MNNFLEDGFQELLKTHVPVVGAPSAGPWSYKREPQLGCIDGCEIKSADGFVGYIYNEADARLIVALRNAATVR